MFRLLFKSIKGIIKLAFTLCFAVLLFVGITNAIVVIGTKDNIITVEQAATEQADCIVVLGCNVYSDGTPSDMLKDRILKAVELYKAGAAPKILMSGDHEGTYYDEVTVMKNYAISCGVPSEDIFLDHYGLSTYETMYRSAEIFELNKIIVVTQEYHLTRAIYIAQRLGMEAYGTACDTTPYRGQFYRDAREIAARTKDFLFCIFKPEPKYLGEVIPVTGSGDVTNER